MLVSSLVLISSSSLCSESRSKTFTTCASVPKDAGNYFLPQTFGAAPTSSLFLEKSPI